MIHHYKHVNHWETIGFVFAWTNYTVHTPKLNKKFGRRGESLLHDCETCCQHYMPWGHWAKGTATTGHRMIPYLVWNSSIWYLGGPYSSPWKSCSPSVSTVCLMLPSKWMNGRINRGQSPLVHAPRYWHRLTGSLQRAVREPDEPGACHGC